jgi:fluoride ion exporter CrcB/FEX
MSLPELLIGGAMVALGAMVGTPARFFVSASSPDGSATFLGTLVVNVSGCVVMGTVAAFAHAHGLPSASDVWLLVATGFSAATRRSPCAADPCLVCDAERWPALGYIAGLSLCRRRLLAV